MQTKLYRLEEQRYNNQGLLMTIVEYKNSGNIIVEFEDGYKIKSQYYAFEKGYIKHCKHPNSRIINREGEKNINLQGCEMIIKNYINCDDITVSFGDGINVKSHYTLFKKGQIKNPYYPTVLDKGYMGIGKFDTNHISSTHWRNIIFRCFDEKIKKKHPTYKNCTICEEWLNFQNFAQWYEENLWSGDCTIVDKDILIKGNKVYSPDTCVLVDQRLNVLFVKNDKLRGKHPIGVYHHKGNDKFIAQCGVINKKSNKKEQINLGSYETSLEAFQSYKKFKESYIKQVTDEYKEKYQNFPKKLYESMYNYEVEIAD